MQTYIKNYSNNFLKLITQVAKLNEKYNTNIEITHFISNADVLESIIFIQSSDEKYLISPLYTTENMFNTIVDVLNNLENKFDKQKQVQQQLNKAMNGMSIEMLQALCDFNTGTDKEPLTTRENRIYEMALAEQVRRKTVYCSKACTEAQEQVK